MSNVILLDREFDTLRRVRKDAIAWIPAKHHRVFKLGYDTWISRHSNEAKRQLAREFMKMPLPVAKDTVNRLLTIFIGWEGSEKGEEDGKMGLSTDSSGSGGECDTTLPPMGAGGNQPSGSDLGAGSSLPFGRKVDLAPVPD